MALNTTREDRTPADEDATAVLWRRWGKEVKISWYLKHYVNHIYEKNFLIARWKIGESTDLFEPMQRLIRKNKKKYEQMYSIYYGQIMNPKTDDDYEVIFYVIQVIYILYQI